MIGKAAPPLYPSQGLSKKGGNGERCTLVWPPMQRMEVPQTTRAWPAKGGNAGCSSAASSLEAASAPPASSLGAAVVDSSCHTSVSRSSVHTSFR